MKIARLRTRSSGRTIALGLKRNGSAVGCEPVVSEPGNFCGQRQAARGIGAKLGPRNWRQVADPTSRGIRFHMRTAANGQLTKLGQVDFLAVDAADVAARGDDELHI